MAGETKRRKQQTTGRRKWLIQFALPVALMAGFVGCGGKKNTASSSGGTGKSPGRAPASARGSVAVPAGDPSLPEKRGGVRTRSIRVLLAEDFRFLKVEGSQHSEDLLVEARNGSLLLLDVTGSRRRLVARATGFRLQPAQSTGLRVEGRTYRGVVEVFVNPLGLPVAVNELEIEDYLKSVVPNELGPDRFPYPEALKAQAVAARTFAVSALGTYAARGFDVFADLRSQVYDGVASEHPLTGAVIEATKGVIATYRKKPILALYSSTCGGRTEAFDQIFKGAPIDYLRGGALCHDEESPYHRWEETVVPASIRPQLERLAAVGPLKQLIPLRRTRWGRIVEMRFVGENGEKVLKGLEIRNALGLRSNLILEMVQNRDRGNRLSSIEVRGGGWGHSVGLCQFGAVDLARRNFDYESILKHYYSGVELTVY